MTWKLILIFIVISLLLITYIYKQLAIYLEPISNSLVAINHLHELGAGASLLGETIAIL
jgi:hypothetical protein